MIDNPSTVATEQMVSTNIGLINISCQLEILSIPINYNKCMQILVEIIDDGSFNFFMLTYVMNVS